MRTKGSVRLAVAAGLAVGLVAGLPQGVQAEHQPADKVIAGGSEVEQMVVQAMEGDTSETVKLLEGSLKTSNPTDVLIHVTAECSILTNITTIGNDDSQAVASLRVWVDIDGTTVPVTSDADGQGVVFCNRSFRRETLQFDDEDATIRTFLETRQANGFNWISLNLGSGVHKIEVFGELKANVSGTGEAKALVGKRTLIVEPAKLANDAEI